MNKNKKPLALTKETIRSLDHAELDAIAGGSETWFLTVCAPCKTVSCPPACGGGGTKTQ